MQAPTTAQPSHSSTPDPLADLFEAFVKDRLFQKGWSQKTVHSYRQGFSNLQRHLRESSAATNGAGWDVLSKAVLQAWVVSMRARGMGPGGANVYIRGVNSFLSWMHAQEHMPVRLRVPVQREEQKTLEIFSDRELRAILAFKPTSWSQWRIWVLMFLLLDTGCRITEVLELKEKDVDLDNLLLTVHRKWKKEGKVPFSLEFRKILWRFLQLKRKRTAPAIYIFCTSTGGRMTYRNAYRDIHMLLNKLGVTSETNPHKFRHTYASKFIANGGNPFQLQRLMGHNSIQTTLKYVHLQTEDLKAAHSEHSMMARLRR